MHALNDFFDKSADQAADLLRILANKHRLLILCSLINHKELNVGQINECTPTLSQSALSQHLARMREDGVITYRRDAQTLYYQICDDKVECIIAVLKDIFCPET